MFKYEYMEVQLVAQRDSKNVFLCERWFEEKRDDWFGSTIILVLEVGFKPSRWSVSDPISDEKECLRKFARIGSNLALISC